MNFVNYNQLSGDIRNNIFKIQSLNVDLVVGLPRSGMIPAYMIGLYLNIPCTDIRSFILNEKLKSGYTRRHKYNDLTFPQEAKKVLVVDDSINTGQSLIKDLKEIKKAYSGNIVSCAIYSSSSIRSDVDLVLKHISLPRVFEWNIFHHSITEKACFDIDGVLCLDPTPEQNDDGENYEKFLIEAKPLFLPTRKVYAVVTSRLEKYRDLTEQWLDNHNIKYEHLIMLDLPTKEDRQKLGAHAKHKASFYKKSNAKLFLESDYKQSVEILKITNKPVFCVDRNMMLTPGKTYFLKEKVKSKLLSKIFQRLPDSMKNTIRLVLRKI